MARTRRRQTNTSSKLWLVTGLLVLLLIAGLYYLKNQSETIKKSLAAKNTSSALQPAHKPKFDFYTILPQSKIVVQTPATTPQNIAASPTTAQTAPTPKNLPVQAKVANQKILPPLTKTNMTYKTAIPPATSKSAVTNAGHYLLQVAAVKDFAAVDHFKAALTLSGYNVIVQKTTINNTVWSRISVGPYSSLNSAQAAQARLLKSGTKSILLKLK